MSKCYQLAVSLALVLASLGLGVSAFASHNRAGGQRRPVQQAVRYNQTWNAVPPPIRSNHTNYVQPVRFNQTWSAPQSSNWNNSGNYVQPVRVNQTFSAPPPQPPLTTWGNRTNYVPPVHQYQGSYIPSVQQRPGPQQTFNPSYSSSGTWDYSAPVFGAVQSGWAAPNFLPPTVNNTYNATQNFPPQAGWNGAPLNANGSYPFPPPRNSSTPATQYGSNPYAKLFNFQ